MVLVLTGGRIVAASLPDDMDKQITAAISAGDARSLSGFLNNRLDLSLLGEEETVSKAQAEQMLIAFFKSNPIKTYKVIKSGTSVDGSRFSIGELKTETQTLRVYFLMKKSGDSYLIYQFSIEAT